MLERAILTGNRWTVERLFEEKVIKLKDITPAILVYAEERSRISKNQTILDFLKQINPAEKGEKRKREEEKEKPRKKQRTKETCMVCLDGLTKTNPGIRIVATCQHKAHSDCLKKWRYSSKDDSCTVCGRVDGTERPMPPDWERDLSAEALIAAARRETGGMSQAEILRMIREQQAQESPEETPTPPLSPNLFD